MVFKMLIIAALVALVVGGGGARLRGLLGAAKKAPKRFQDGLAHGDDPVHRAKDVTRPD